MPPSSPSRSERRRAEVQERNTPLFVVGFQRSGTTLLQALLGAHPRIAAPPETYFVGRVYDHADYFGDLSDDANLEAALHELLNPPLDFFSDCGFDERKLLTRTKAGPRTYASLLDTTLRDFAEREGKARWVEKSAGQPLTPLLELFPEAKAVHIVRDPRDVVASSLKTAWTDPDAAEVARAWRSFVLVTVAQGMEIGPAQFLQVRYEDLARDPGAVLRVICAFVGEDYDPGMVEDTGRRRATVPAIATGWQGRALSPVAPTRPRAWERGLERLDQVRVHAVAGSLVGPLGYRPPRPWTAVASAPFELAEGVRRAGGLVRRRAPSRSSPQERYQHKRSYLEAQAERVRSARIEAT